MARKHILWLLPLLIFLVGCSTIDGEQDQSNQPFQQLAFGEDSDGLPQRTISPTAAIADADLELYEYPAPIALPVSEEIVSYLQSQSPDAKVTFTIPNVFVKKAGVKFAATFEYVGGSVVHTTMPMSHTGAQELQIDIPLFNNGQIITRGYGYVPQQGSSSRDAEVDSGSLGATFFKSGGSGPTPVPSKRLCLITAFGISQNQTAIPQLDMEVGANIRAKDSAGFDASLDIRRMDVHNVAVQSGPDPTSGTPSFDNICNQDALVAVANDPLGIGIDLFVHRDADMAVTGNDISYLELSLVNPVDPFGQPLPAIFYNIQNPNAVGFVTDARDLAFGNVDALNGGDAVVANASPFSANGMVLPTNNNVLGYDIYGPGGVGGPDGNPDADGIPDLLLCELEREYLMSSPGSIRNEAIGVKSTNLHTDPQTAEECAPEVISFGRYTPGALTSELVTGALVTTLNSSKNLTTTGCEAQPGYDVVSSEVFFRCDQLDGAGNCQLAPFAGLSPKLPPAKCGGDSTACESSNPYKDQTVSIYGIGEFVDFDRDGDKDLLVYSAEDDVLNPNGVLDATDEQIVLFERKQATQAPAGLPISGKFDYFVYRDANAIFPGISGEGDATLTEIKQFANLFLQTLVDIGIYTPALDPLDGFFRDFIAISHAAPGGAAAKNVTLYGYKPPTAPPPFNGQWSVVNTGTALQNESVVAGGANLNIFTPSTDPATWKLECSIPTFSGDPAKANDLGLFQSGSVVSVVGSQDQAVFGPGMSWSEFQTIPLTKFDVTLGVDLFHPAVGLAARVDPIFGLNSGQQTMVMKQP